MLDKSAIFSADRKYRYELRRIWQPKKPYCCFVCLNPSTADENFDDPTIRRCIGFAESFYCGGMVMVNMYAFRSTDPVGLLGAPDPVGPDNDDYVFANSTKAGLTIAAWGAHNMAKKRESHTLELLKNPHYLDLTKDGHPRHPLYLKKTLRARPIWPQRKRMGAK